MNLETFDKQWHEFIRQSFCDGRFYPQESDHIPVLDEDTSHTSIHICWEYLAHCSWAARVLARTKPKRHVDIGSYVYFAGVASAFVSNFEFYDMRPLRLELPGILCGSANLIHLPFPDDSIESLSCLHVIEHCGLGRYGDELDAAGDIKAARELIRVLAPGGKLLIVQPMNEKPRLNFNAHRVYSMEQIMNLFTGLLLQEATILFNEHVMEHHIENWPTGEYTACLVFEK